MVTFSQSLYYLRESVVIVYEKGSPSLDLDFDQVGQNWENSNQGINWEKPSVHRVLQPLYRTLPLVQIGPATCELLFKKLQQGFQPNN